MAKTAVLCSAGLDSAVLVAAEARTSRVQPLYVSVGLGWEDAESQALARLTRSDAFAGVDPVVSLRFDMTDVYPPGHWAIEGRPPAYDTPDEDVYLAGRNLVLLTKGGVFCASTAVHHRLALGILAGNPFPDATPAFLDALGRAMSLGLHHPIQIAAPFSGMHKSEVILLGMELGVPLGLTLSCMSPTPDARHCGSCSKCRERRDAFHEAGVSDPTEYAAPAPR